MLSPEAAWARIEAALEPLGSEEIERSEAVGRTLAREQRATVDVPAADVSAMDGYALAGEPAGDLAAGEPIEVVGVVTAGAPAGFEVPPGKAARIMTGAVVPAGVDRVVPIEQTDGGRERVLVRASPAAGAHVRRRGEVLTAGAPLLGAGTLLTPGAISLLASHGAGRLAVTRVPRVAVLTTGDEVVPPEVVPGPGQLRDSNTAFLLAAGRASGFAFRSLGIAPDVESALRSRIERGLESDVLLLCGGVSMGELDLVEGVLAELGCETLFDKVAIQPGKPLVAARHPGGWVFGLPGNPASVMVTFWLFVRPLLRRLMGQDDGFWQRALGAELAAPLPASKARDLFLPAELTFRDGRILAAPRPPVGSHDTAAYARGTALVRARPLAEAAEVGAACEVLSFAL